MICPRCEAENGPHRTRCWRCQFAFAREGEAGRDRPLYVYGAVAPDPVAAAAPVPAPALEVQQGGRARSMRPAVQPPLFPREARLIEFGDYCIPSASPRQRTARPRRVRAGGLQSLPGQFALDFDGPNAGRASSSSAGCYPVASLGRRSIACVADLAIALALGAVPFLVLVRLMLAEAWPGGQALPATLAAALWLIVGLYHLLHAASGRPTPGQRFARLRLVTLQGRPGEPAHRVWRVVFNLCPPACLLGAVWAALTEERFSWADQVSGTYFTAADAGR